MIKQAKTKPNRVSLSNSKNSSAPKIEIMSKARSIRISTMLRQAMPTIL